MLAKEVFFRVSKRPLEYFENAIRYAVSRPRMSLEMEKSLNVLIVPKYFRSSRTLGTLKNALKITSFTSTLIYITF